MTRDERRAKCIEAMARQICIASGYRYPDEDWTHVTNGEPNSIIPSIALPNGQKQRWRNFIYHARRALDSLHGIARVVPIEATEKMLRAAQRDVDDLCERRPGEYADLFRAMSAAGDLTNQPEKKP